MNSETDLILIQTKQLYQHSEIRIRMTEKRDIELRSGLLSTNFKLYLQTE